MDSFNTRCSDTDIGNPGLDCVRHKGEHHETTPIRSSLDCRACVRVGWGACRRVYVICPPARRADRGRHERQPRPARHLHDRRPRVSQDDRDGARRVRCRPPWVTTSSLTETHRWMRATWTHGRFRAAWAGQPARRANVSTSVTRRQSVSSVRHKPTTFEIRR